MINYPLIHNGILNRQHKTCNYLGLFISFWSLFIILISEISLHYYKQENSKYNETLCVVNDINNVLETKKCTWSSDNNFYINELKSTTLTQDFYEQYDRDFESKYVFTYNYIIYTCSAPVWNISYYINLKNKNKNLEINVSRIGIIHGEYKKIISDILIKNSYNFNTIMNLRDVLEHISKKIALIQQKKRKVEYVYKCYYKEKEHNQTRIERHRDENYIIKWNLLDENFWYIRRNIGILISVISVILLII